MKTITVFATSLANVEPGRKGYILSLVDPDADSAKPLTERTFISGYAVPVNVEVPTEWTIGEAKDGMTYLWAGETALILAWYHNKGRMIAWPAVYSYDEAKAQYAIINLRSQKLAQVNA